MPFGLALDGWSSRLNVGDPLLRTTLSRSGCSTLHTFPSFDLLFTGGSCSWPGNRYPLAQARAHTSSRQCKTPTETEASMFQSLYGTLNHAAFEKRCCTARLVQRCCIKWATSLGLRGRSSSPTMSPLRCILEDQGKQARPHFTGLH